MQVLKSIVKKKEYNLNTVSLYVLVILTAFFFFILLFGVKSLNPFNIDWILKNQNLYNNYLKWDAYRNSDFVFPILGSNTLSYPDTFSYISRDNPIFLEIIFKLLSDVLPTSFQFFGAWGFICYILQGLLAVRLFGRFFNDNKRILVSSVVYIGFISLMGRMNYCNALSAQWLITLMMIFYLDYIQKKHNQKTLLLYTAILSLCAVITSPFYSILFVIFLLGCIVWDILNRAEYISFKCFLLAIAITYMVLLLLGGINELFDGITFPIPKLSIYAKNDDDILVYVGLGELLVIGYCLYEFYSQKKLLDYVRTYWKHIVTQGTIIIVVATLFVIKQSIQRNIIAEPGALSFYFTLLESIIVAMFIVGLPVIYLMVYIIGNFDRKKIAMVFVVILLLQLDNTVAVYNQMHSGSDVVDRYDNNHVNNDFWKSVADNDKIKKVVFLKNAKNDDLVRWAIDSDKSIESGAFSNDNHLGKYIEELEEPDSKTLFVFDIEDETFDYMRFDNLYYYRADGYILGCKNKISGADKQMVQADELCTKVFDMDDGYVNLGYNIFNRKILLPGGLSYGPYCSVQNYNYVIEIYGKNLFGNIGIEVYSEWGKNKYSVDLLEVSDEKVVVKVYVDESANDFEVYVKNQSREVVSVDRYVLIPTYKEDN